jgi:DNA-binding CsgD family transcriptional regulator
MRIARMALPTAPPPLHVTRLRGRDREARFLDALLDDARAGTSRVLVVRGELGIGKTALLDGLCERATGLRVVRARSAGSEMELAYAGLHQVCGPFLDRLDRLPAPQADALAVAFGLRPGDAPDPFLVGLAVLTLLSGVADERPLLCVVDDAQWLDRPSAHALAFAARRLMAEPVALVFAVREPCEARELAILPELTLEGLADQDARALLESAVAGPLDDRVRDRIVAETRGNPLALLELPRGLSPGELAGGFGVSEAPAIFTRIEESYVRRLRGLPEDTRRLLLVAAADPLGDPVLVLRAADRLGATIAAAAPAAEEGLVELGGQVRFSHPLVRRVVYRSAAPGERMAAHHALAEATDPVNDPDRRAWHRGQATAGLDEDVALALEQSAARARARGGMAAGAAFLQRAAELTPDPAHRARRALAAARAKQHAGAPDAALRLLAMAEAGPLDAGARARVALERAEVAYSVTRGGEASALLLDAARGLAADDADLARETHRDAFLAALSAGALAAPGGGVEDVARALLDVPQADGAEADLLRGLAVLTREGYAAAAPILQPALAALREDASANDLRWLWLGCTVARALGDDAAWDALSRRALERAREVGALSVLPIALTERFSFALLHGDAEAAWALAAEADVLIDVLGTPASLNRGVWLAAWRGRDEEAAAQIAARREDVVRRGEGQWLLATAWMHALSLNGLGRYDEALAAADRAEEHPLDLGLALWVLPELVEAAARGGDRPRAEAAAARVAEIAEASGTDWARGMAARGAALLASGETADALYREAIARLEATSVRSALARAHLLYGEWLRRERRRSDARTHLRTAHELLSEMGADAFAERARRELIATGESPRRRTAETRDDLTAQEAEIARLAAGGQTNPEIGAQLFLSPRTVEWHLRKVFGKLGVSSRKDLGTALAAVSG